jgi:hypothetical protein
MFRPQRRGPARSSSGSEGLECATPTCTYWITALAWTLHPRSRERRLDRGRRQGVSGWKDADPIAVYRPWGCGICHSCQTSAENYCEHHASLPSYGGGLGSDGGSRVHVPSPRLLIPLGKLDPVHAAPLTDAALTPYLESCASCFGRAYFTRPGEGRKKLLTSTFGFLVCRRWL